VVSAEEAASYSTGASSLILVLVLVLVSRTASQESRTTHQEG
jgi:hypothetical protein